MIGTTDPSPAYVTTGFVPAAEYTYKYGQLTHQSYLFATTDEHVPVCFLPQRFPNCTRLTVGDEIVVARVVLQTLPENTAQDPLTNGTGAAAVITGAGPVPYPSNRIGLPEDPDDGGINCSFHVSPRFR